MVTKQEAHQRLEEIAREWKPGYWVYKGTGLSVPGTSVSEAYRRRNLQYRRPHISYRKMEAVLQGIFTNHASRKKVKPGIFSSDATNREGDAILMFREFPFYECDPEYAEYAWQREKPLGIERRQETKRQSRNYGTKYLAWIHPLDPNVVQNLPLLEHYDVLWSEEAQFPNAHIQWKNTEYPPFQSRDFLERLHELIENGVWGSPDKDHVTFLRTSNLKLTKTKCGPDYAFRGKPSVSHGPSIKLVIDPIKLAQFRDIYYDIEGTIVKEEFKKTFMIRGGLPFPAIHSFHLNPAYFRP